MSAQATARGVKLVLEWPREPVKVRCDRRLAERVIFNLLSNAIKVSPVGEKASVILDVREPEAEVRILDAGPGIPPRARAALFDLSEKEAPAASAFALLRHSMEVDNMCSSSGLGLAFSKMSVDLLGGRIDVAARSEGGSMFCFTLPLAASSGSAASRGQSGRNDSFHVDPMARAEGFGDDRLG
jgi:signal transduction histidine kinase